jgi:hypothetical protein
MWLDLKRTYMALRPRLRRNYGATDHPEIYGPVMDQLGGGIIPQGVAEVGGRQYHGLYLEFGPSSVDGWLARLTARELGLPEDDLLDVRQRQVLVDGRRVDLTPKEFEVVTTSASGPATPCPGLNCSAPSGATRTSSAPTWSTLWSTPCARSSAPTPT